MDDYNEKEALQELQVIELAENEAEREDSEEAIETGINYTFNV